MNENSISINVKNALIKILHFLLEFALLLKLERWNLPCESLQLTVPYQPVFVYLVFILPPIDSRWPAVCCGGAGAGKKPTTGADTEPGGALPGPGGSTAAAGPYRGITGSSIQQHTICAIPGLTDGSICITYQLLSKRWVNCMEWDFVTKPSNTGDVWCRWRWAAKLGLSGVLGHSCLCALESTSGGDG